MHGDKISSRLPFGPTPEIFSPTEYLRELSQRFDVPTPEYMESEEFLATKTVGAYNAEEEEIWMSRIVRIGAQKIGGNWRKFAKYAIAHEFYHYLADVKEKELTEEQEENAADEFAYEESPIREATRTDIISKAFGKMIILARKPEILLDMAAYFDEKVTDEEIAETF